MKTNVSCFVIGMNAKNKRIRNIICIPNDSKALIPGWNYPATNSSGICINT